MKAKLITALLVVGVSLQAAAMGHPHNLFAARKHIKIKRAALAQSSELQRSATSTYIKQTVLTTTAVWTWFTQKKAK